MALALGITAAAHTLAPTPRNSRSPPRRLLRAQNLDGRFDLWFAINWEGPVLGSLAVIMLVLVGGTGRMGFSRFL